MTSLARARHLGKKHTDRRYRADFAASITRSEFGRFYTAPNTDNFVDASPAAIALRRTALWGGAAR